MQINTQPGIRPIPARRKPGDKLDASKNVTSFENQVQSANPNLKRQQHDDGAAEEKKNQQRPQGKIDTTA